MGMERRCSQCGQMLSPQARYCPRCGAAAPAGQPESRSSSDSMATMALVSGVLSLLFNPAGALSVAALLCGVLAMQGGGLSYRGRRMAASGLMCGVVSGVWLVIAMLIF